MSQSTATLSTPAVVSAEPLVPAAPAGSRRTAADPGPAARAGRAARPAGRLAMVGLTVVEVVASIAVVHAVRGAGGSELAAYLCSLVPPLLGAVVYWAWTRDLSRMSLVVASFNLLSAVVAAAGSHDPKVLLYKDCVVTAVIGLAFLASLAARRPLSFWFAERFATDGTPAGRARWDGLWQYPAFRTSQRGTTVLWAVVMLVEAAAKAYAVAHTGFEAGYVWTQVLPMVATAVGIGGSMALALWAMNVGRRARAAA